MTEPSGELVGVVHILLFEGNVLVYDPASNGMEWVPVWGTVNDLSSMEDASARELINITLLDSPKDIPQMDQFGECHQEPAPVPPAVALHARAAHHAEEEVMGQELPEGERKCGEYTEEVDLPVFSPWNSTDSDRNTEEVDSPGSSSWNSADSDRHTEEADSLESSLQNSADSDRQTKEEDEGEMSDEPTGEPADRPANETAVKLTEGDQPDNELIDDHPPGDELTKEHPPDCQPVETITVECPTLGQELPPRGTWEEDRVVVHACQDVLRSHGCRCSGEPRRRSPGGCRWPPQGEP